MVVALCLMITFDIHVLTGCWLLAAAGTYALEIE